MYGLAIAGISMWLHESMYNPLADPLPALVHANALRDKVIPESR